MRNDLLEGISLNKMGEGRRRVSAKLKGLRGKFEVAEVNDLEADVAS